MHIVRLLFTTRRDAKKGTATKHRRDDLSSPLREIGILTLRATLERPPGNVCACRETYRPFVSHVFLLPLANLRNIRILQEF